jgi:ABC-type nitrate/sulfonate/bicarbonate transport system ATPase subunit
VLYYVIALVYSGYQFNLKKKQFLTQSQIRQSSELMSSGRRPRRSNQHLSWLARIWQYIIHPSQNRSASSSKYELVSTNYQCERESACRDAHVGLAVSDVSKSFLSTEQECEIQVLSHINARLFAGTVTTLLGSNGGGKSTLLRILCGFDSNHEGNVHYAQDAGDARRVVGWCSQNDALYSYLTIREHLELYCELLASMRLPLSLLTANNQSIFEGISTLLTSLDLLEHQYKYPTCLSGGMKRRLSLALASLGDPVILLLDEPTSGCDR